MKKFMKAIAFVTVMCMALSTVAFAANSVPEIADADKTFVVTVTEAGENEQVALMVVAKGADFSNPLYINQQAADENGETTFEAVLSNAEAEEVDVYVGYAANTTGSAVKVGTVKLEEPVTNVVIEKAAATVIPTEDIVEGSDQTGAGVYATFNVTAPEGTSAAQMIWAIRFTDAEGDKVKYSDPIILADYGIGSVMSGSVQLALAFLNGSKLNEIDPVSITAVDAIFLFTGADDFEQEVLTNPADAANKDN